MWGGAVNQQDDVVKRELSAVLCVSPSLQSPSCFIYFVLFSFHHLLYILLSLSPAMFRLWNRDQKVERYFLVLEKGSVPYSVEDHGNGLKFIVEKSKVKQELRINTSSNLAERAKKGGYAEKSMKAAAFLNAGGSNKKIKFED